jgi:hypothetical protein
MDIRDILKSFDQLSEGDSTVHKAGPGGYGNKHGSEDVTDQYGKPIGRMSLGKLGAENEPKRGKGRPPNPDKAQSYDSSALSKAMGMGKAPKPTGKPSVKHSLKEYFNELDDALNEAGLAVQPMPVTPQQKQQQAVASKPSFMIKDPANPTTPAITTSDPAVVSAAKNGTMTMQKPGAAPTAGAAPAAGSGSQLGAMAEAGDVGKHNNATTGFDALVRKLTPKYGKEAATKIAGAQFQKMKEGEMDEAAKWRDPKYKDKLYTQKPGDSDDYDDMDYGYDDYVDTRPENDPGQKRRMGGVGHEIDILPTDPLQKWHRRSAKNSINTQGKRAGLPSRDQITSLKQSIKNVHGQHRKSNLPEADAPQHFAQSSPLSTANRGVLEGTRIPTLNQLLKTSSPSPKDTYYIVQGSVADEEGRDVTVFNIYYNDKPVFGPYYNPKSATRKLHQLRSDGHEIIGERVEQMDEAEAPQHYAQSSPMSTGGRNPNSLEEGKKGVNPFAKKDTKKKPDDDGDGVPDWADKKPGKDDNEGKKKGAAPKKGVNPFAKKTEKQKVKEGMEHNLQAARLEGKSHALRKMPYNCTHDGMEEARHYHDGFKEGLDECYGQMPIMGRTAVDEMGSEVGTMASYGSTGLGEMDKTSYMKQQAIKTPGDTFKAFGQTMSDNNVLDEFAFEAFDNQLSALLESEEKVSEGMTVSISKGQHGSPDSVSVSAQDGEADQLLSIIKSAGLGLFGGEEKGFNAPEGGAGAHGGISVVDDHDGMMALMKRLSGGEMSADDSQEGEEEHSHEGEEETCNECGGMMEAGHSCGSKEVVDEVESEDQMAYKVAEDNPPDSGADNTDADVAGNAAANSALATADAGEDEEEGKVYSSPTNESDEDTDANCKKCDCSPCKCETVAESFANLYKKLAFLSEESTEKEDEKAEEAGKKVAKDIEYDEGHKGKDDDKAEEAGKKVAKDIEYDDKKDKKDKKVDESYANSADDTFEADIDFMTKIISGGPNKQKSTGQTTVPVISGQGKRTGIDGKKDIKESMLNESVNDWKKLAGIVIK